MFAKDCRIPTSDPLCRGVHNDIRAMIDGTHKVPSSAESVVDNDWDASLVRNCSDLLEVWDVVSRVANALDLEQLSAIAHHAKESKDIRRWPLSCRQWQL